MADGIIFRTVDMLRWGVAGGVGSGGNLTPLQFDENFWALLTRIQALESNPPVAISVSGFTVVGSQFLVNMSNGSTRGPYDLPIATFRLVGDWVNSNSYLKLDIVSAPHFGLYLVNIAHTSPAGPALFDPAAVDTVPLSPTFGLPLYKQLFGEDTYIYDLGFFFPGKPGIGIEDLAAIAGHVFVHPVTLPISLTGSSAKLAVAPTSALSFPIKKNGVSIGSVDFAPAATSGTFTFAAAVDFAIGDRVTIMKPTAVDPTARELAVTIKGTRIF